MERYTSARLIPASQLSTSRTAPSIPTSPLAAMAAPQATFAFLVLVLVQVVAAVAYLAMAVARALAVAGAAVAAAPEETVVVEFLVTAEAAEVAPYSMVQAALTSRPVPADSSVVVQAAISGAMAMVAPAPAAEAVEEERTNRV